MVDVKGIEKVEFKKTFRRVINSEKKLFQLSLAGFIVGGENFWKL